MPDGADPAAEFQAILDAERLKPWAARRHSAPDRATDDYRTPYERDRDRLLYSSSFRRLAGITQITSVHERHLLHNRLTHSLKVGQLGRRMAERLCRQYSDLRDIAVLEPDAVEAAGLAHDLGHPPFGHTTEDVLHNLVADRCGGFEGNAQTFRIVTKLATRGLDRLDKPQPGLDLTRVSLNAILKYPQFRPIEARKLDPWTDRSRGDKWGAYRSEQEDVNWADESRREDLKRGSGLLLRSANALLMDWADDISFATHDIEDYIRAGLIPLDSLFTTRGTDDFRSYSLARLERKSDFDIASFDQAFSDVVDVQLKRRIGEFQGKRFDRAKLSERVSTFIQRFVQGVERTDEPPYLSVPVDLQYEVEILKALTWFYVIDTPSVATVRHGQANLIRELFEILEEFLTSWVAKPSTRKVPMALRELYEQCTQDTRDARSV